jgi:hypothetical protein
MPHEPGGGGGPSAETANHTNRTSPRQKADKPKSRATATEFDYDKHVVDRVDDSLWRAVFDGHFRIAVRCDVCGRWLTEGTSKRAFRGPRCAAKAKAVA